MPSLFNVVKLVNGRLVQFDDFSNTINPVQPSPESEPSEPIPSNPDPEPQVDPLNPLGLPPYTIRVKYEPGTTPGADNEHCKLSGATVTQVSGTDDTWDVTYQNTDWSGLFYFESNLIEVLGANTSDVRIMGGIDGCFEQCTSLTSVAAFNTENVTTMQRMFAECGHLESLPVFDMSSNIDISAMCLNCQSLQYVPLFANTGSLDDVEKAFEDCIYVLNGAFDLYQQLSTQDKLPTKHYNCFRNCGYYTDSGQLDLSQIPPDWGGPDSDGY
jgi:surface protein